MEDPNILDLQYSVFSQIQSVLENPGTMQTFLEVLPPDCSSDDVLISMELSSRQYNNTPAKELLRILGNKGATVSNLIGWFQEIGLEKALAFLKKEEMLQIIEQPLPEVKVCEGSELLLTCTAVSHPPPEYQWFKDDVELLLQDNPVLSIKSAKLEDCGTYACLVTKRSREENTYEWLYSNFSQVEVIQSDMHAMPPYESSIFSTSSFVTGEKRTFMKAFHQDKKVPLLSEGSLDMQPKLVHSSQTSELPNKEIIVITKQPFVDGIIAQGMSLCLICEAVSSNSLPVNYQWLKNGRPLRGQTTSCLLLDSLYPDPDGEKKWTYQCKVYNDFDEVLSQITVVELDESNERTPYVATQKFAFMVANDTYDNLEDLKTPAADISDLANMLSSMGFKIFAFRNLTLTQLRNAFTVFCEMLTPGSYALFFFAGHGFDLYGQTYLLPVDSSDSHSQLESICTEYILQGMQEREPAMNVLFIDACRKLPPRLRSTESQSLIRPGKIFRAKMKNNTIYGYSTSFLCASHESDEEINSVFVKHLKKHIEKDKCIEEILMMVKNDFSKDPLTRNVQFPVIKSSLAERRKLNDPIQNPFALPAIMEWCDVRREKVSRCFELSLIKSAIIVEFHHHMEVFCNGIDTYVYFQVEPNAQMFILNDIEINLTFQSQVLDISPVEGVALKDVDLSPERRNFLFKKTILNTQKLSVKQLKGNIFLKFLSKNITQNIDFNLKLKICELQLSVNHLASSNVEEPLSYKNQNIIINSFKEATL